jgi:hypothetical protein
MFIVGQLHYIVYNNNKLLRVAMFILLLTNMVISIPFFFKFKKPTKSFIYKPQKCYSGCLRIMSLSTSLHMCIHLHITNCFCYQTIKNALVVFFAFCPLSMSLHMCIHSHIKKSWLLLVEHILHPLKWGFCFISLWQDFKCHIFNLYHNISFKCDKKKKFIVIRF